MPFRKTHILDGPVFGGWVSVEGNVSATGLKLEDHEEFSAGGESGSPGGSWGEESQPVAFSGSRRLNIDFLF